MSDMDRDWRFFLLLTVHLRMAAHNEVYIDSS
jgi:hypothetical protein